MPALTRVEPFEALLSPFSSDLFRQLARSMRVPGDAPGEIRIDVTEHDKEYVVRAEMPGARKEDIRVSVDGNFVSISAEVRREKEEKSGGRTLLKETYVGSAARGFSLAHEIDAKAVVAKLEDGVLKLVLPKSSGTGSRSIATQ